MIAYKDVLSWLRTTQSADMSPRTRGLLIEGFRRRFKEIDMDPIEAMLTHIESLRELIQDFDFEIHNDEANEDHIQQATAALDALDGHVNDLVP